MPILTDDEAIQLGVGIAQKGRQWILSNGELSLYDKKRRQVVYRKKLDEDAAAVPPPIAEAAKPVVARPPIKKAEAAKPVVARPPIKKAEAAKPVVARPPIKKAEAAKPVVARPPIKKAEEAKKPEPISVPSLPRKRPNFTAAIEHLKAEQPPEPREAEALADATRTYAPSSLPPPITAARSPGEAISAIRMSSIGAGMPPEFQDAKAPAEALQQPAEIIPTPDTDATMPNATSPLRQIIRETKNAIGGVATSGDSVVVTEESLKKSSKPAAKVRLVIDPNINQAWLTDESGDEINRFPIGTGDVTGTIWGKKYFTPSGEWNVINEVPYEQMEGGFGPLWMGLSAPHIGLHGPHQQASLLEDESGFINQGYVSHGCIRFREADILEIGRILDVGANVTILPYSEPRRVAGR
jgi:lipoprotein-anchoring transpeptidase ErfK/SrfK